MRKLAAWLLVVVIVLAGLLVAADRVGAYVSSQEAAKKIAAEGAGDANVVVHGVPFLTQVAASRLDRVTVTEPSLTRDGVTLQAIRIDARGVHLSLSDVLHGRVQDVPIDHVDGSAVASYAVLSKSILAALGNPSTLQLSLTGASGGELDATLTGPFGLSVEHTVPVPTVSGGRLQLGQFVQRFADYLPSSVTDDVTAPLPSLPYGLRLTSAAAQADGVHFAIAGSGIDVSS